MNLNNWPPPTINLNSDKLLELKKIALDFVNHVNDILPEICEKEGHIWDNINGTKTIEYTGGTYCEGTEKLGSISGYVDQTEHVYFVRTCTRCNISQKLKAIVSTIEKSPFV